MAVGSPVSHVTRPFTQGAWMKDPLGIMGNETIFVQDSYTGSALLEFENMDKLIQDEARVTYQLPYTFGGTGALVYGKYLYYNRYLEIPWETKQTSLHILEKTNKSKRLLASL